MSFVELPWWAEEYIRLRHTETEISEWTEDDPGRYSRVVHIAYPNGVYYVVDKLVAGKWIEQSGDHQIPETAISTAQKKSYFDDVPYRVREVVWNG